MIKEIYGKDMKFTNTYMFCADCFKDKIIIYNITMKRIDYYRGDKWLGKFK